MTLAKSKKSVGLGNLLMKDRFSKGNDRKKGATIKRVDHATGDEYLTNAKKEAGWVKMRSVTQQGALDEFLATAELADTDFTADRKDNVKIIHVDQKNPYLLTATEERKILGKHDAHKGSLTVPRRPKWDASTSPEELDALERRAFLDWRRGLAELQENNDLLMTPFERNLEVWRQMWRVIERSDLVVQIVDARSPLLFRSEDLDRYVKEINPRKQSLLLINKADMLTVSQRKAWAEYLIGAGIAFKFFSAALAKESLEAEKDNEEDSDYEDDSGEEEEDENKETGRIVIEGEEDSSEGSSEDANTKGGGSTQDAGASDAEEPEDESIKILTVHELEALFMDHVPEAADPNRKINIGLVGYPNVGKSSTINALIGATKVSVSSTPGKTKHFQTINLTDKVILCDCPGLVFPNFATTNGDLICNGVLPIDQMREYTGPCGLVAQRIPKPFLEALYGIKIKMKPLEEGGTGTPTAEEFLFAYARARGFQTQGLGQPDASRAARIILKDYVKGKLIYCHPPPGDFDPEEFNRDLYDEFHLPEKRRGALAASLHAMALTEDGISVGEMSDLTAIPQGAKSKKLDKGFFGEGAGNEGHLSRPFNYKYTEQGRAGGKGLSGRKAKALIAAQHGVDVKDVRVGSSKKHYKGGPKMGKVKRRGIMHDDD
ncbi:related to putative human GTP-binding protein MMR1 [Cephalotrichum gorgonifer]|uniref:Related to putative human GTP-binding protein MMR1 n=1 Tax=Cephalotrichum gorgonifer TaxID=2041049 RepID=A0AAE8MR63_9PEZI|nr:related to putative human GTP-binding protein MMR1 [Cephalotrichum gorgonifer]